MENRKEDDAVQETGMTEEVRDLHVKPKLKRPRRRKTRDQVTVRIDKDLMAEANVYLEKNQMRLTDLVEEGVILCLNQRDLSPMLRQCRLLSTKLPLRLQKLTLSFWVYVRSKRPSEQEEMLRALVEEILWNFKDTEEYARGLEKLGGSLGIK